MNRAILLLLIITLSGCASVHHPKRKGNLFAELLSGDRVHIRFQSGGCFHHYVYDFEFERSSATTVRIASLSSSWNTTKKAVQYHSPKQLGTLTLTPSDIAGLDRLMRYYHTHPTGACTTIDDIAIEHFDRFGGSTAIASEHYIDDSCGLWSLPRVTTLTSLVERLKPKPQ